MARRRPSGNIGQNLRKLRAAAGLTQLDLGEAAGIADATLSRIERGRVEPSADVIGRLAKALKVSADQILGPPVKDAHRGAPRASEAKLLAAVRDLEEADVDDVTRAVKLLIAIGRRTSRPR